MATISFTIPDAQITRAIDALCYLHDYDNNAQPSESRAAFARRHLAAYIRSLVLSGERQMAAAQAEGNVTGIDVDPVEAP